MDGDVFRNEVLPSIDHILYSCVGWGRVFMSSTWQ